MKSTNQVSDSEEIRLYLLGSLQQIRREQFETRLFEEPTLHDELVASEDDLVDEYLAGQLSEQERYQFEANFMVTPERRIKVKFGRTFGRFLDSSQVGDSSRKEGVVLPVAAHASPGFLSRHSVLATTLGAVICLGSVGIGWLAFTRKSASEPQRSTISITLRPGTTRAAGGATQKISRPPTDVTVGFRLELGKSEYRKYKAELMRETESVAEFNNLNAQPVNKHFAVDVLVDGSLLENEEGDYRFKLSGISDSGELIPAEEYGFRVNK